jgi:hypothetical protein
MISFTYGMITMGLIACGLFFLRFWSRTRDPLFLVFSQAFWLLAISQALVALADTPREEQTWFYLLRLAAFGMIIAGILAKNLRRRENSQAGRQ